MLFCALLNFFKIKFHFQIYHQSEEQFGFKSDPTLCQARSGSKLFAKVTLADDTSRENS